MISSPCSQAGPLSSIRIPRGKNYAFVRFEYEESVPYAVKLFEGVSLFDQRLKLQNKALGLGTQQSHYNNHYNNRRQMVRTYLLPHCEISGP